MNDVFSDRLSLFYKTIRSDARIGTTHISLYVALYQMWIWGSGKMPILIKRKEVMELAKISSSATYHKCLRQLVECGFIQYVPCLDPSKKSEVYFLMNQPEMDIGAAGAQPVKR